MTQLRYTNFPVWALCYAINGDPIEGEEGEKEQKLVDEFLEGVRRANNWAWTDLTPVSEECNLEQYFSYYPLFGKGADCCDILIFGE